MPMKRKEHLDKAAWAWAETVDHADISNVHMENAYRIKLKPCKAGSCRRNCRGNPHCLSGIGERSWLSDISDETWHKGEDPEAERRKGNSFVGLRNLGATCYVNSLLQLWFHNLAFRKAVYLWQPDTKDEKEKDSVAPATSVAHLQRLFALMQFGPRKYLDPTAFVLSLGLDTMTQQDAQEFSKLFLSMLEEQLASSSQLPEVRDMVPSQFLGEYDYVTRCLCCGTESECPSTFYELDLNISSSGSSEEESPAEKPSVPRSSLAEFLQEFVHEEKLEGADRYHCAVCGSKQDARRNIKLRRLPPVLTFQLLRFVFDRTTGHKKKLNSFVYFPEELDMSPYLSQPPKPYLYSLRAVLAHKGSSAYSGHYVAHICDTTSGGWYRFNDEAVEKLEGKKLQLGCDEDLLDAKKRKRPRTPKGQLSSNNAYMLVYVKVESGEGDEQKGKTGLKKDEALQLEQLPPHLIQIVTNEKEEFEAWVASQKENRELSVQSGKERQAEIRSLYEIMPVNHPDKDVQEDVDWDFLSINWLTKWLEDGGNGTEMEATITTLPPVNHTPLLCPHGRLRPDLVTQTKCISTLAADQIYERFGGGPRLKGKESMCRECVTVRCRSMRLRAKTAQDAQTITTLLKTQNEIEKGFWVGKASLRSWRRMALEEEDDIEGNDADNGGSEGAAMEGVEGNVGTSSCNGSGDGSDQKHGSKEEEWNLGFNCDILCIHGNLCPKDNNRRLVPEAVWKILKGYFPTAPEFTSESEKCSKCEDLAMEGQASKDHVRQMASTQREKLTDLYLEKGRPSFSSLNFSVAYIIPRDFLNDWRRFIREPNKRRPPVSLCNQELICRHGGFLYDPCPQGPDDDARESSKEEASTLGTPTIDVEADSRIALIWDHEWASLKELYKADLEIVATNNPIKSTTTPAEESKMYDEVMEIDPNFKSPADVVNDTVTIVKEAPVDEAKVETSSSSQMEAVAAAPVAPASDVPSSTAEDKVKEFPAEQQLNVVSIEPLPCRSCIRERLCRARESLLHYSRAKVFVRKVPSGSDAVACPVKEEEEEDDPEFKASAAKRARGRKANGTTSPSVASQLAGEVRRSTRHRRIRGEEEVVVSSDSTLRDFKVKIMRLFGVAPFDQHLSLGGRDLIDPQATLSDLRVYPGSVITLKADEPWEDSTLLGDFDKGAAPEEGFKGTGLLSS